MASAPDSDPVTFARWLIATPFVALGLFCLTASFVSHETMRAAIDPYTFDGSADFLTVGLYRTAVLGLRVAAAVAFVAAYAASTATRTALRLLGGIKAITRTLAADLRGLAAFMTHDRAILAGMCAILAIGVAVRTVYLNQQMRADEAFSYEMYASKPITIALSYYIPNNHLLNTISMKASAALLGFDPWALRLPAFVAGILLIVSMFVLTAILYGREAGVIAAALSSSSAVLILFSTNARGYTLQLLLMVWLLLLALRLRQSPSIPYVVAFMLVGAAALYTMPSSVYILAMAAVWMLPRRWPRFDRDSRRTLIGCAAALGGAIVLAVVLYMPVILVMGPDAIVANRFVESHGVDSFYRYTLRLLPDVWEQWHWALPTWVRVALVVAACAGLAARQVSGRVSIVIAAIVVLVLYVLQRVEPFPRFWLFMLPLFQLLVAAGIALALGRLIRRLGWRPSIRRAIVAAVAVLLCATISIAVLRSEIVLTASETGRVGDSVVIAATLAHDARPGDHFILSWKHGGLVPYYWRLWGLPNRAAPFGASTAKRLFVLDTTNQPVTEVVKSYEFHTGERDLLAGRHAVLKHRFSSGSLYELVKE